MSERIVHCAKLGKEAPGLGAPPFSGELGDEIFNKVSAQAWSEWSDDFMIKVINEYRLDLTDEKQYNILLTQMRAFLGLEDKSGVLEVENSDRGKSGQK